MLHRVEPAHFHHPVYQPLRFHLDFKLDLRQRGWRKKACKDCPGTRVLGRISVDQQTGFAPRLLAVKVL